jgi:hypothetical protein
MPQKSILPTANGGLRLKTKTIYCCSKKQHENGQVVDFLPTTTEHDGYEEASMSRKKSKVI